MQEPASGAPDRPVVIQHSFGSPGSGGPVGALGRVLESDLATAYDFRRMHQERATGGIDLPRLRRWVRELRATRPDLVHVRGLGNEGFHAALAARLAGCPRVLVSIHGTVRDLVAGPTAKQRVIVNALEPATLRMATHVTTVCEYAARRDFLRPYAAKLVGPVVNGVELPAPTPAPRRSAMRRDLELGDADVALISVGRLTVDKGHHDLAAALRLLPRSAVGRFVLVLVGDGPDAAAIRDDYAASGVRTRVLGTRHDVPDLLGAADVFVFPSLHENLSNALLEAMSHALPVVATDVGGNTEVLAGGGGVLVAPRDPEALSNALAELLDGELPDLGRAARRVVEERYTVERMCSSLDAVYRLILEER